MGLLLRSAVLGVATGGRSAVAFTVPVAVATRGRDDRAARAWRAVAALTLAGEVVGDKLPVTPSRLDPAQIVVRVLSGAAGAASLAVLDGRRAPAALVAALAGGVGAFGGSVLGASWRQWAADQGPDALRPDARAALVEDAVVLTTARALAAR